MIKHRRITGAVAVALLAVVATAAHWSSTSQTRSFLGSPTFDERWTQDVNTLPTKVDARSEVFFERAKALSKGLPK